MTNSTSPFSPAVTVAVPAMHKTFRVFECFRVWNRDVCFFRIYHHFARDFGRMIVLPSADTTLAYRDLTRLDAWPLPIRCGLKDEPLDFRSMLSSPEPKLECTLAEFYSLLLLQGNGSEGALLVDGCWNVFHIRCEYKTLCVVAVRWKKYYGWEIDSDWFVSHLMIDSDEKVRFFIRDNSELVR